MYASFFPPARLESPQHLVVSPRLR